MDEIFTKIDYQDDGPPPRSRRLVAICSWSWSLAHSRTEVYWISGSHSRWEWSLWCKPTDPDLGTHWFNPASVTFERPKSAVDAAKALPKAAWSAEWKSYEAPDHLPKGTSGNDLERVQDRAVNWRPLKEKSDDKCAVGVERF